MTRFIGNRIGNLPFPDGYGGGGLFNTIQHLYYKQQNDWGRFTVSHSGEDLKIPSSTSGDGYNYLIYTGGGSFAVEEGWMATSVDYMVVGGGGAGGRSLGPRPSGGGGAGGMRTGSFTLYPGLYIVSIGAGGATGSSDNDSTSGESSYISGPPKFGYFTSTGGGHGGGNTGVFDSARRAAFGGSGGGGCAITPSNNYTPRAGGGGNEPEVTPPQGNPGGNGKSYGGGGGGGAGGYGLNGTTSPDSKSFPTAMNGGIGREFGVYGFDSLPTSYGTPGLSPTGRWFAGGGGGGSGLTDPDPLAYGLGGYGGGGDGGVSRLPITYELAATSGEDGLTNTGGGGGSPGSYTNPRLHSWLGSGDGGPGIVIIGYVYQ